jgi:CRP/FNR family transcriptional regulator, cyclic AMP receptor protein
VAVDADRLKDLSLFSGMSDRQRAKVAPHCHAVIVPQGEHLLDEGYSAYEFFVIEEGKAAVVSGDKHLRDLGPGDFLGEIAILSQKARTASVIATSNVKAIAMSANDFREMTESIPEVAKQINDAVEDRLERDRLFGLDR